MFPPANNTFQENAIMSTFHPLKTEGILPFMAAILEVVIAIQTYVADCVRRLFTHLLTVGSVLIHISKLHHLALVLKHTFPPTSHNNSKTNNNAVPTLVRCIIWPTTLITWIFEIMIFLVLIKLKLVMVQVWKSLILELYLYLIPLRLLVLIKYLLSLLVLPKICPLLKSLPINNIYFEFHVFFFCFFLRITWGTSFIKVPYRMASISFIRFFNVSSPWFCSAQVSVTDWHRHLGHACYITLRCVLSNNNSTIDSNKRQNICPECGMAKTTNFFFFTIYCFSF